MKRCPFCAEEIQDAAIVCRFCQRDLPKPAPSVLVDSIEIDGKGALRNASQPRGDEAQSQGSVAGKRAGGTALFAGLGIFGFLVLAGYLLTAGTSSKPNDSPSLPASRDDLEHFVNRFGRPTTDDSTAYDSPRPAIVTRMLTYDAERVRAIYRADVQMGVPPPYDGKWKLIGFTDPTTDAALKPAEAVARLAKRDRGKK